jgi:transcriptional regulator with XRE-family HTH domain
MNLNTKDEIKKAFKSAFSSLDAKEDLEHDTKMIMYRFLSEVERISDEKELNRKELATLIGTSASYITQLFRGNKLINLISLAKFQKVLDITFEIKAIPNNIEDAFKSMNVDNIIEKQNNINGFWAFHNFKPTYNDEPNQILNPSNNFERRIA